MYQIGSGCCITKYDGRNISLRDTNVQITQKLVTKSISFDSFVLFSLFSTRAYISTCLFFVFSTILMDW